MREYIDESTGEIVAVIGLAQWDQLVRIARSIKACPVGACNSPACALAHALHATHSSGETFGPLAPRPDDTERWRCVRCARLVTTPLQHYDITLGCWQCRASV